MIFWIVAAVLAFIAALCVALPLARGKDEIQSEIQLDKALYQARISEIDQDLKLGRISSVQAQAAKTEEGRKLIAVAKHEQDQIANPTAVKSPNFYKLLIGSSVILIPLISLSVYLTLGSPSVPDQSLASRISADPAGQTMAENIARVESHLAKTPNDASGWAVLAPVYSKMNRNADAANAWAKVLQLNPKYPEVRSLLAEAILRTSDGIVTKEAKDLFASELKINPASARSRYYIALSLSQEGKFEEASKSWQLLIDGSNPQAPWLTTAKNFRDEAIKQSGTNKFPTSPKLNDAIGPTKQQVLNAQKLSDNDRASMIENMVAGLAAKLQEDPSDKEGWLKLIRAYNVLHDKTAAMTAISKAKAAHIKDATFIATLDMFEQTISNQDQTK